jgi:small subunit ribosomal protein S4
VVFRLGLATSRAQARQLVAHGHIDVNGRRTKAPSYLCKAGDGISVHAASLKSPYFKNVQKEVEEYVPPKWLSFDSSQLSGKVINRPSREEIDLTLSEQLIVEYYSR